VLLEIVTVPVTASIDNPAVEEKAPPDVPEKLTVAAVPLEQ
jgi:hypothetical protein